MCAPGLMGRAQNSPSSASSWRSPAFWSRLQAGNVCKWLLARATWALHSRSMPADPAGGPAPVEQKPDFPALEESVLAFWRQDHTFEASVECRPGGHNEYVFYDGPPLAHGLPH